MPTLPLDHPEPLAATLGVMLYPGTEELEQNAPRASQYLAEPLGQFYESGYSLADEDSLARKARDSPATW